MKRSRFSEEQIIGILQEAEKDHRRAVGFGRRSRQLLEDHPPHRHRNAPSGRDPWAG